MSLKHLLRMLLNNERLVQKLAESYPIRRAAQLTAYFMQRGNEKLEEIKESDAMNKLKDDAYKAEQKLGDRASKFKSTFFTELQKEWEKEKKNMDSPENEKKQIHSRRRKDKHEER